MKKSNMSTSSNKKGKKWVDPDGQKLIALRCEYETTVEALRLAIKQRDEYGGRNKEERGTYIQDDQEVRRLEAELDRIENRLAEVDPVEAARRQRKQIAAEAKQRRKQERAQQELQARENARTARADAAKLALAAIRENVSEILDAANNVYQEVLCRTIDRDAALDMYAKFRERLKSVSLDRQQIAGGLELDEANASVAGGFSAITALEQIVRADEPAFSNVDDWESLLPDTPDDPVAIPCRDIQKQLLNGINLAFPFADDKPAFRETASHPVMNASRVVGSTLLYMKSAKMARTIADHHFNPKKPPVVFDIGAGSFGAKRLQMLKSVPNNRKVAIHASIPVVQDADNARDSRARHNGSFVEWNYLPETKVPSLNRLNYCRHTASECDCMKYYDERGRYALAIHSAYYFRQRDWQQIFKYTDQVECLMHVPKVGETIPLRDPEFEWVDVEQDASSDWLARTGAFVKRLLTGDRTVKLKPLRHGETTYTHSDVSQIITRGGFHFTQNSAWIEEYCQGDRKTATAAACVAAAGAVGGLVTSAGAGPAVAAASAVAGAANALVTTAAWARFENWRARCGRPMCVAETVTCHVASSFGEGNEEDIVTVQRFRAGPPRELVPELVEAVQVDKKSVGRVAAALALAKDLPNGIRQMAGSMLREDVPIKAVRDTLGHAQRVMRYVLPNDRSAPNAGRWLAWAIASPLFACSPLALLSWTQPAAYLPAAILPIVGASLVAWKLLCLPTILALCLIACMG